MELKRKGKLQQNQKDVASKLMLSGFRWVCVDNYAQATYFIDALVNGELYD